MGAVVLDLLLVMIFLMMVPIGFYRGGLRELCTSGGLLLGILMAQAWSEDWSSLLQRILGMANGSATFVMSILITFGITAVVGYGGSAAFSYRPGPGGRMYGAFLSLCNAMIASGFLINQYSDLVAPTRSTNPVDSAFVARILSQDFGTILLVATVAIGLATVFGMFVRERDADQPVYVAPQTLYQPVDSRPYGTVGEQARPRSTTPVRIQEVQDWQESAESQRPDPSTYGSGWRQTWPDSTPAQQRNTRTAGRSTLSAPTGQDAAGGSTSRRVLADWIKDDET